MQTPERYYEGLFWDGFSPEKIGAVPLLEAESEDDEVQAILAEVKERVEKEGDDLSEFFITIEEPGEEDEEDGEGEEKTDSKEDAEIICRVWHMNVFLGARDAASGDPGERCRSYHFRQGRFVRRTTFNEGQDGNGTGNGDGTGSEAKSVAAGR